MFTVGCRDAFLPKTWPMQSNVATKAETRSPDQSESIASQVAGLRLGNETEKATQSR